MAFTFFSHSLKKTKTVRICLVNTTSASKLVEDVGEIKENKKEQNQIEPSSVGLLANLMVLAHHLGNTTGARMG